MACPDAYVSQQNYFITNSYRDIYIIYIHSDLDMACPYADVPSIIQRLVSREEHNYSDGDKTDRTPNNIPPDHTQQKLCSAFPKL